MKAHWEKREANLDEEVEKKANQKGFELAMGPYRTESDPEDIRKPEQAIEIIEPDEFGADENYETSFLSFYADGKLVFDGEDEPCLCHHQRIQAYPRHPLALEGHGRYR